MTPAELILAVRVHKRREKARRQERDMDLYLLAAMIGQAVWGKLERFEAIFERGKPGQEMTDGEMLDMVRALNAAMGGKNTFDGQGGGGIRQQKT